jgi:CRISPR-associated protein Csb2
MRHAGKVIKPPFWNLITEAIDMHVEKCIDRPANNCVPALTSPQRNGLSSRSITFARFTVDSPVLPLITDTLPLAEAVRTTLMHTYQRLKHHDHYGTAATPCRERFFSPTLSGKDATGTPLSGHGHAFYLPADEDRDGRIDHVTVFAADGFTPDEVRALDRFRQLRHGEGDPLRLLLVGLGQERDFHTPLFAEATTWVSTTPFLVTRYPKRRGRKRDRPEHYASSQVFARHVLGQELARLAERRGGLPPCEVVELADGIGPGRLRPIQFQRFRRKRGDDGGRRPGGGFRLVFATPVRGPLCLGHSAHFGLGLFLPE